MGLHSISETTLFQLMVDGASLQPGQAALLDAEEEPEQELDPALTQHQLVAELSVRVQTLKLEIATLMTAQVQFHDNIPSRLPSN